MAADTSVSLCRLGDIEPEAWDRMAPEDNFYLSHGWLRAVDRQPLPSLGCLVARDSASRPVGMLPVYLLCEPGGNLYDPAQALARASGEEVDPGSVKVHRGGQLWPLWSAMRSPAITAATARTLAVRGGERLDELERALARPVQGDLAAADPGVRP